MATEPLERGRDVFVSHSRRDARLAMDLVRYLERAGLSCWIAPRDIPPGEEWAGHIKRGIASSGAVLLLLSESANRSRHVAREVQIADDHAKPLLPVMPKGLSLSDPLAFYLATTQRLETDVFDIKVAPQVREGLRTLSPPAPRTSPAPLAVAQAGTMTALRTADATLWRVYASVPAYIVVFVFYLASYLLTRLPGNFSLRRAAYGAAFGAGAILVAATRQLNVPVLFTIGLVQPMVMLSTLAWNDLEIFVGALVQQPPIACGFACAAGGAVMSLRYGVPGPHALSLSEWLTWIAPRWRVLHGPEKVESIVKAIVIVASLLFTALSLR